MLFCRFFYSAPSNTAFGTAHGLGLVEKYCLPWLRAIESARQMSLLGTCQAASITQPDRLTWSCDHASRVLSHRAGVTTVERPDPKGLSTFSQCTEFSLNRSSGDPELGALTTAYASLSVSTHFSTCYYVDSYTKTTQKCLPCPPQGIHPEKGVT